jgi:hypothetical protein
MGSFKFNILAEGLQREKQEKVAFARLFAALLEPISGLSRGEVSRLVASYAEEVYQFRYNYRYTPVEELVQQAKQSAEDEQKRLMDKVAALTVKG